MLHDKKNYKKTTTEPTHDRNHDDEKSDLLREKLKKFMKNKEDQMKGNFRFKDNLPQKRSIPINLKPTKGCFTTNQEPASKKKQVLKGATSNSQISKKKLKVPELLDLDDNTTESDLESIEESFENYDKFNTSPCPSKKKKSLKNSTQELKKIKSSKLKIDPTKKSLINNEANSKFCVTESDTENSECPELIPINQENTSYDDESDSESFSVEFDEENSEDDISVYDSDDYNECFEEATAQADVIVTGERVPIVNPLPLDEAESHHDTDIDDGSLYNPIQIETNTECNIITAIVNEVSATPSPEPEIIEKEDILISSVQKPTSNMYYRCMVTDAVLALIKEPFYIYGALAAKLVGGFVNVLGFDFEKGKFFEIFSLRGYGELQMSPVACSNVNKMEVKNSVENLNLYFLPKHLDALFKEYDESKDAIVLLYGNAGPRSLSQGFQCEMTENIFPKTYCMQSDPSMFVMNQCVLRNYSDSPINIPREWQLLKLQANSKMMIVGGKGVGKSTLLRYLVNSNLRDFPKILVIDLDIGQSELFLPQTVSCKLLHRPLLGPGYFYNLHPDKAFAIGKTNILLCDELYFDSVEELLKFCHNSSEYKDVPWVINTMGYNKGFGMELIGLLCKYIQPTDVVQLQSKKAANNFDDILHSLVLESEAPIITVDRAVDLEIPKYNLHLIHTAVAQENPYKRKWQMNASDKRYANVITHLSYLAGDRGYIGLLDARSEKFSRNNFKLLNLLHGQLHTEANYKVEIGLVLLCNSIDSNKIFECFGIGILRGVDNEFIEIVHRIPSTCCPLVNCGIFGEMVLPKGIYLYQLENYRQKMFVHSKSFGDKTKAVRQIYRRPKKFLLGTHKKPEN